MIKATTAYAGILLACSASAQQMDPDVVEAPSRSEILINVNGDLVPTDLADPTVVDSRVLVPLRGVLEKLGVTIAWYPQQKVVVAGKDGHTLTLGIGAPYGTVDGKFMPLDVPARIENGRTMVPLRYLAEAVGAYVLWDEDRRVVVITTKVDSPIGSDDPPPPTS